MKNHVMKETIDKVKFYRACEDKNCRICNKPIYIDIEEFECVSTKRKNKFVFHTQCLLDAARGII